MILLFSVAFASIWQYSTLTSTEYNIGRLICVLPGDQRKSYTGREILEHEWNIRSILWEGFPPAEGDKLFTRVTFDANGDAILIGVPAFGRFGASLRFIWTEGRWRYHETNDAREWHRCGYRSGSTRDSRLIT
ncbi:hypothetical protein PYCC9005_002914 [Savitreella phatthalungensis]